MADDSETIVIRVNAAQGEAALKALGNAGIEAGKGIESVGAASVKSDLNLKDLTRNIGAGISLMAILRDNLEALKPALEGLGNAIKFSAVQAGASEKTVNNLGLAIDSLIHPSHIAANAVESMKRAWAEFEEEVVGSSTVIPNSVRTIEESLTALAAARKAAAAEQEDALAAEQKALDATAKAEAELEAAAVKSAEERAKAEARAAEEIEASLARERAALNAKLAEDEARLQKSLGAGGKIDTSADADAAKADVKALREEIKRLENQPMLDPNEQNKLNELKDQAAQAAGAVRDLGKVFTQTADDFLTESEAADAAGAAWDVYGDRLAIAARRHEDAIRSTEDADAALFEFGETAEDVAGAIDDAGKAAGELGDKAAKGTDKASEGLGKMKEGLEEAIPLANELKGILQEIVTLGAQADI